MDERIVHTQLAVFFLRALGAALHVFTISCAKGEVTRGVFVEECVFEEDARVADG